MTVRHGLVDMRMGVRLLAVPREIVRVLMMGVVAMAVVVCQRLMRVLMLVALAGVQPERLENAVGVVGMRGFHERILRGPPATPAGNAIV
ncbi:hypothetical protein [Rhodanobacter ginsengiterrae]|uniref:hypothetical protein n=1 Tax=Rhodanobacter ginsengiterrae TaxID=2008451 RepID=UPI003CF19094